MVNEITDKFRSKMTSLAIIIDKSLRRRDDIYFKKIDEHAKTVKKIQETKKLFTYKVFGLSSSIRQFKEFASDVITRTNNVMVMDHEQRQDSNKKYVELRGVVTLSTTQVESMVETIRLLIAELDALKDNTDKKG